MLTTYMERPDDINNEMMTLVDKIIVDFRGREGGLIPALQATQETCGYLPIFLQDYLSRGLTIPSSTIYGVVTFYSFFTMKPRGRHTIRVCMGTACFVKGSNETLNRVKHDLGIEVGDTTEDKRFTLEAVRCLGACGLAPITIIDEDSHRDLTSNKVTDVLAQYE